MVNRRYEERISGATIEASILRSEEEELHLGVDTREAQLIYLFARPWRELSQVLSRACQSDLYPP